MTSARQPRGARLGLPANGPGSLAPTGRRLLAFLIDAVVCALVAAIFVHHPNETGIASRAPGFWSLIPFAVDYIGGLLLLGRTLGMRLTGLRVVRVDAEVAVDPWRAVVRTVLLALLIPALVFDRDGRGFHERLTDTAVIVH
ncbi:MAG: RDD family protein [Jatrophihabitans sp.]